MAYYLQLESAIYKNTNINKYIYKYIQSFKIKKRTEIWLGFPAFNYQYQTYNNTVFKEVDNKYVIIFRTSC